MRHWLVTADDRTGALEAAAEIAAWWGPVTVAVDEPPAGDGVVDLASRHLSATAAVQRLTEAPPARWAAHKIDSTLRGNWAAEVRARARALGRPAVVVAAWPQMGRSCEGGVVRVHGAPRATVTDQLPEADVLSGAEELGRWLAARRDDDHAVATVDVVDERGMAAVAGALVGHEVLLVGPAGPIGAAFGAAYGQAGEIPDTVATPLPTPALVVRGSATSLSRSQVAALVGTPGVEVLEAPPADGELDAAVAIELAGRVHAHLASCTVRTLVLVGGDTAAAVLGAEPRLVGGTVAPGLPWSRTAAGDGPLVVTKAGGFGTLTTLVDLFVAPADHRARD